jgi:selenocysteine-specific translation elongation factor
MNIALLNDREVGKDIGKKGTVSDFTIYNYSGEKAVAFYEPTNYPEKLQPLLHVLQSCDYCLLFAEKVDALLGEQIVALDLVGASGAVVCTDFVYEQLKPLLGQTSLKDWPVLARDAKVLVSHVLAIAEPKRNPGRKKLIIDHSFSVKSVGDVVLGNSLQGINKHEKLFLYPVGKEVFVRSIQVHDKEVESTKEGDRTGLCLKGAELEEMGRGAVLGTEGISVSGELACTVRLTNVWKKSLQEVRQFQLSIGLQFLPAELKSVDAKGAGTYSTVFLLGKPASFEKGDLVILTRPEEKLRVVGAGRVA